MTFFGNRTIGDDELDMLTFSEYLACSTNLQTGAFEIQQRDPKAEEKNNKDILPEIGAVFLSREFPISHGGPSNVSQFRHLFQRVFIILPSHRTRS
jgi:hypothetical protein